MAQRHMMTPGSISLLLGITSFSCGHLAYLLMLWALYNMLFQKEIPERHQEAKLVLQPFGRANSLWSETPPAASRCVVLGW